LQFNSKYNKNLNYTIQISNTNKKIKIEPIWSNWFNKFKDNLDDW
jgi:hypothetical protein